MAAERIDWSGTSLGTAKGKPLVYLAYAYRFIGAAAKGDGSEPAYNEYRL